MIEKPTNSSEEASAQSATTGQPLLVRLPGFIADDDIGLGNFIKRATHTFGIKSCTGCEGRAAALNRWLIFTRRNK
jgi:hypothetical protein